jgi:hypothetical protein
MARSRTNTKESKQLPSGNEAGIHEPRIHHRSGRRHTSCIVSYTDYATTRPHANAQDGLFDVERDAYLEPRWGLSSFYQFVRLLGRGSPRIQEFLARFSGSNNKA